MHDYDARCFWFGEDAHRMIVYVCGYVNILEYIPTAFASWMFHAGRLFVDGGSMNAIFAILLGVYVSFSSFVVGTDFHKFIVYTFGRPGYPLTLQSFALPREERSIRRRRAGEEDEESGETAQQKEARAHRSQLVQTVLLFLATLATLAAVILASILDTSVPSRNLVWQSAALAPVGALIRYALSKLNPCFPNYFVGTLSANLLACTLDASLMAVFLHVAPISRSLTSFLLALFSGLGGSLSTVSTWVAEMYDLSAFRRYAYGILSITFAQILIVLIYGIAFRYNVVVPR